ncbi:MAG TPA: hypothetical protein VMI31_09245 [Fimbriimonadaceae bacterium]|nr:hypothetical protein [Fimbriimonadaceae bacterium]
MATALILAPSGGCGGGGIGSHSTLTATGTVTLPPGFTLPLSQLSVVTEAGAFPIGANGSFSAKVPTTGPRIVQLIDQSSNKIVLLGYVDAATSGSSFANGQGSISPASTADALLFAGLGGGIFPTDQWGPFIELIHSSSQEAQVASVIASSVAADPTAISDDDTAIENAVESIQSTYVPPSAPRPRTATPDVSVQTVFVSRSRASVGALINVTPTDPQSTLVIAPNPNGDGIVAVSNSRRRAALFIYKVGAGPSASNIVPIDPPQEVAADVDVEPEHEIGHFFTSILNGLQGKFDYIPVTSPPILLKADSTQEVAQYEVVAIGPGLNDTFTGAEALVGTTQAERNGLDQEWTPAMVRLYYTVIWRDIVKPTLEELIEGAGEAALQNLASASDETIETAAEGLPDVAAAVGQRDIKTAVTALINDVQQNTDGIKAKVIAALAQNLVSTGILSAANFQKAVQLILDAPSIIKIVNKGLFLADLAQASYDNTAYNTADVWTADVLKPKGTLTPNPATVNDIQNIAVLTAQLQNVDPSQLRFKWSTPGKLGHLEEPNSSIDMPTGITSFSQAAYVADINKLQQGATDTVTVAIYVASDVSTPLTSVSSAILAQPGTEYGRISIDSTDVFQGLIDNDPWVLSIVATCPYVEGATSYIVEASGPTTGNYTYYVSTAGGHLQVLDSDHKPYSHYVANATGVTIAVFGFDAANAGVTNAAQILQQEYPLTTDFITYQ